MRNSSRCYPGRDADKVQFEEGYCRGPREVYRDMVGSHGNSGYRKSTELWRRVTVGGGEINGKRDACWMSSGRGIPTDELGMLR
jgi:hypothetical protein